MEKLVIQQSITFLGDAAEILIGVVNYGKKIAVQLTDKNATNYDRKMIFDEIFKRVVFKGERLATGRLEGEQNDVIVDGLTH